MLFVMTTTSTAAVQMFIGQLDTFKTQLHNGAGRNWTTLINSGVEGALLVGILACAIIIIVAAAIKIWNVTGGFSEPREERGFEPVIVGK
jgi:nitrate/nitrite-specific signal transduction histidine kinase